MTKTRILLRLASAAAALILSVGPSLAQNEAVPCSAFSRDLTGGWHVLSPVMLDLGGMLLAPTVGTTFEAGKTMHGVEMSSVLNRECGNNLLR